VRPPPGYGTAYRSSVKCRDQYLVIQLQRGRPRLDDPAVHKIGVGSPMGISSHVSCPAIRESHCASLPGISSDPVVYLQKCGCVRWFSESELSRICRPSDFNGCDTANPESVASSGAVKRGQPARRCISTLSALGGSQVWPPEFISRRRPCPAHPVAQSA
jgi:hypothetical protein